MGNRRTIIVVVAVVLAGIAGIAMWRYLSTVNDRAFKDAQLVDAFVVKKDIDKGLPGEQAIDQGFIAKDRVPRKFYPAKAIKDAQEVRGKIALAPVAAGLVVVEGDFVDPRVAIVSFRQTIPTGQQAITISVDSVKGVAGFIVAGDRVNMLVTQNNSTGFMLQNLQVLAVGQTTTAEQASGAATKPGTPAATPTPASGLITLAVSAIEAAKIAEATAVGSIYLTLVPPDFQPAPVPAVGANSLFA